MLIPKAFYFIRHGETDWNVTRRLMGQSDIPLNINGNKQAHSVAQYIKNLGISRIVSSPLLRAKRTAEIIGSYLDIEVEICDSLKECSWGTKEGLLSTKKLFNEWINNSECFFMEPYVVFKERVLMAINSVLNTDRLTLIVSHGGVGETLIRSVNNDYYNRIPNTGLLFFTQANNTWLVWKLFNFP